MKRKQDPNQSRLGDMALAGISERLGEGYEAEHFVVVTYEEARALNGQFEARWATPEGALCKTFDVRDHVAVLRPGDKMEFRATLKVERHWAGKSDVHVCDSL